MASGIVLGTIVFATFASVSQGDTNTSTSTGVGIAINYFGAVWTGPDQWLIDGTLNAEDPLAVTITFGGAANGITTTPDAGGYFSIQLISDPGAPVSMDASDSHSTAYAETMLESFEL